MTSKIKTLELINLRKPRHALTREIYRDEDVYQQDLEQIWHKEWIFAGHTIEINKAGEYITLQVGDYPVVVVRDDSGAVRAFHNACRHRGSRVCSAAKGKAAKLVCPYHKWTFGLDGKLIYAGNMGENFNNDDHGLMPVHCEVVNSYIYICVAEEAPGFEQFRKDVSPFITPHNLEDAKVAHESNIVEDGNWNLPKRPCLRKPETFQRILVQLFDGHSRRLWPGLGFGNFFRYLTGIWCTATPYFIPKNLIPLSSSSRTGIWCTARLSVTLSLLLLSFP